MGHYASKRDVSGRKNEWAVILAGGDGTRLKSLTRRIAGDERPKQFCRVLGKETLVEETQGRAKLELAPERTLYVVNQIHEPYYKPILGNQPSSHLVVQPSNRGTAPAILYALLRIAAAAPEALVAVFPSDHYISDNKRFMAHIRTALDTARRRPDVIVLLGLDPERPEVGYGWIETAEPIRELPRVFGVRRFWEKPNPLLAQVLQVRGCLWNSFVMVASVQAFLQVIESAVPELYRSFACLSALFGTRREKAVMKTTYQCMDEVNFSTQILARHPEHLAALRVTGVRWNDLGEPKRVMASLNLAGVRPQWAKTAMPLQRSPDLIS